jgi:hypothetical protein
VQLFALSFVLLFDTFKACTRKLIILETNREGVQGRETPSACELIQEFRISQFCLEKERHQFDTICSFPFLLQRASGGP